MNQADQLKLTCMKAGSAGGAGYSNGVWDPCPSCEYKGQCPRYAIIALEKRVADLEKTVGGLLGALARLNKSKDIFEGPELASSQSGRCEVTYSRNQVSRSGDDGGLSP